MNLFYKIHLQSFNIISIVLYRSGPTSGQVLCSCQDAFVVDASVYWGHLIRHLLNASEVFPTGWFFLFGEQVEGCWAHGRTVRRVDKHMPSTLFQNFRYCTWGMRPRVNPLTPNDNYSGSTAPLTSKRCILYNYSTNTGTEYFKHATNSPFFSLQNAVCFIILTYLVPVLFTLYIQDVLK